MPLAVTFLKHRLVCQVKHFCIQQTGFFDTFTVCRALISTKDIFFLRGEIV